MNLAEVLVLWIRVNITRRPRKIGTIQKEGGANPAPLYLCWCPTHGYFEETPHGWDKTLRCPECKGGKD